MKRKLFFTIITCTKNSEKFIMKNLSSVESQTFKNYEQIIIDGESTDETVRIAKSFSKRNPKIKIFSYPAKGISDAFNLGIRHSNGQYLLFLNSDDYLFDKNVLNDVSLFLKKNINLDWIYGKVNVVEENGKWIGKFPNWKIFQLSNRYLLKFINFIPHQSVFIRNDIFDKFDNFDIALKTNMDFDFWLRIAPKTRWEFYNRLISNYTIRKGSVSSSIGNKRQILEDCYSIQKKNLNASEMFIASIVDIFIIRINRIYR